MGLESMVVGNHFSVHIVWSVQWGIEIKFSNIRHVEINGWDLFLFCLHINRLSEFYELAIGRLSRGRRGSMVPEWYRLSSRVRRRWALR